MPGYMSAVGGVHFWGVSVLAMLACTIRASRHAIGCWEAMPSNAGPTALPMLEVRREVVGVVTDVPIAGTSRPVHISVSPLSAVLSDAVALQRWSAGAAVVAFRVWGKGPSDVN